MYFIVNEDKQFCIGWNAKCACSYIKQHYHSMNNNAYKNFGLHSIHIPEYKKVLPKNLKNYTIYMVIRNPYERIVSGFNDKYKQGREFRSMWVSDNSLTFRNFVDSLCKRNWTIIEKHHFIPQTEEAFDINEISKSKKKIVYDIKEVNKMIDDLNKFYPHVQIPNESMIPYNSHSIEQHNKFVADMHIDLFQYTSFQNYYDKELQEKIFEFYKKDFNFFKIHGYDYTMELFTEFN